MYIYLRVPHSKDLPSRQDPRRHHPPQALSPHSSFGKVPEIFQQAGILFLTRLKLEFQMLGYKETENNVAPRACNATTKRVKEKNREIENGCQELVRKSRVVKKSQGE